MLRNNTTKMRWLLGEFSPSCYIYSHHKNVQGGLVMHYMNAYSVYLLNTSIACLNNFIYFFYYKFKVQK